MKQFLSILILLSIVGCKERRLRFEGKDYPLKDSTRVDSMIRAYQEGLDKRLQSSWKAHLILDSLRNVRYFLISYQASERNVTYNGYITHVGGFPSMSSIIEDLKSRYPKTIVRTHDHTPIVTFVYEFKDSTDYNNFIK